MSKFLNNRDRRLRSEFDTMLARAVRVVESSPNLATLKLCEASVMAMTTTLESLRLTIEDQHRKDDLVILRDRIQELSFDRANEQLNAPRYHESPFSGTEPAPYEDGEDGTDVFGRVRTGYTCGDVPMTDIGTEEPYPIETLKEELRKVVGRLRDASTKGDVTPYTLTTLGALIDDAVNEFEQEVGE